MGIKNFYIASKIEGWLVETYNLGKDFKAYADKEKLTPEIDLSYEQAMEVMNRIIAFDSLNMQLRRACRYMQQHPEITSENTQRTIYSINKAFIYIEKILCESYEVKAKRKLELYIENKKNERKQFGIEGEIVIPYASDEERMVGQLLEKAPKLIDEHYRIRSRWKNAIAEVIEQNREKKEKWKNLHQTVGNYYQRVDEEVKNQIRTTVTEQHQQLMKQHEAFMTWLELYEAAIMHSEEGMKKLFASIDMSENQKAEIVRTLMRVTVSAAITPFIFNIIDPTLLALGGVIKKLAMSKGEMELEAGQQNMLYQLTGFMPDSNKKTYKGAYEKLNNETLYDSIERYKKYLKHKINSISEISILEEMMSDKSKLWGNYTPDDIIRAHRSSLIDDGHYRNPKTTLPYPENENALILEMTKDFENMITKVFTPLQTQYGSAESLENMHMFIDHIMFNNNISGGEAHNKFRDNALVNAMSKEVQISLIVKYLITNTRYFGCTSFNRQLYHEHVTFRDDDKELGSSADNAPCRTLVAALLNLICETENHELKMILGLDKNLPKSKAVSNHTLLSYSATNVASKYLHYYADPSSYNSFTRRQTMVRAIIEQYYNTNINEKLQKVIINFAKKQNIQIKSHHQELNETHILPQQHWLSDQASKLLVEEATRPFIEKANDNKSMRWFWGSAGLAFYQNNELVTEAKNTRSKEETEEALAKNRKSIKLNY